MNDDEAHGARFIARDKVFRIAELVSLVLHQADTRTLINCQRVCRQWKEIIEDTHTLQTRLFRSPASVPTTSGEAITLNPVLKSHLSPIFAFKDGIYPHLPDEAAWVVYACEYHKFLELPWARDGCHVDATKWQAYVRPKASWRRMLISQPPVTRLDWQHTWSTEKDNRLGGLDDQEYTETVTIGMLWDLLEALLVRGCRSWIPILATGGDLQNDCGFIENLESSAAKPEERFRFPGPSAPKMILQTHQWWQGTGPKMHQVFDMQTRAWEIFLDLLLKRMTEERLRKYIAENGDGYRWLMYDCERDSILHNASIWRWSMSDAPERARLMTIHRTRWWYPEGA
jgi:hypothetical protein